MIYDATAKRDMERRNGRAVKLDMRSAWQKDEGL